MAKNPALDYGRDIRCMRDADALFSEAVGLEVVKQDAFHRISTDDILGDDGTGSFVIGGWGFDSRKLAGLLASRLPSFQPVLSEVLTRDPRILSADVKLTPVVTNGLADVEIRAVCTTAKGQFSLIKRVSELTASDLEGQV